MCSKVKWNLDNEGEDYLQNDGFDEELLVINVIDCTHDQLFNITCHYKKENIEKFIMIYSIL